MTNVSGDGFYTTCKGSIYKPSKNPFGICDSCCELRTLTIVYNDMGDEINYHCDDCL